MKRLTGLLLGLFSLTACATGTTNLSLGLTDDVVKPGVISEAPARTLYLAEATEPVTETVADTLKKTFEASGHEVVTEAGDAPLRVDAAVKNFWLDYKTGLVTVEFFGDVQVALKVTDTATGEVVLDELFKGYYSDKTGGGLSKTWTRIMNAALQDLSREIGLSSDLMMVLEEAEVPEDEVPAEAAEDTVS